MIDDVAFFGKVYPKFNFKKIPRASLFKKIHISRIFRVRTLIIYLNLRNTWVYYHEFLQIFQKWCFFKKAICLKKFFFLLLNLEYKFFRKMLLHRSFNDTFVKFFSEFFLVSVFKKLKKNKNIFFLFIP